MLLEFLERAAFGLSRQVQVLFRLLPVAFGLFLGFVLLLVLLFLLLLLLLFLLSSSSICSVLCLFLSS